MPTQVKGKCLCGAVHVSFEVKDEIFDACHCGMCRRWGGSPAMTVHAHDKVTFKGQENITVYDSSDWAQRGFCKKCGTHLYYHLKGKNFYSFHLGMLENVEHFKFHVQIFVDSKPDHYHFGNETEMMTEAQVLAKFGGG